MSTIATGIFKKLNFKKQTGQGTIAPGGAATGTALRRVTSTIDLAKGFYKSGEMRPSAQRSDGRHGVRSVAGAINGELSPLTYQSFFESVLRAPAAGGITSGALVNVTAALSGGGPGGTFTRAAGSFITDGFCVGDIIKWAGWATTGVPNSNRNFMILALTATVMTVISLDGVAVGPKAAGDSVTCTLAGKKIWIPATGQTRDYYTIEHNFSDLVQSERFVDCVVTGFNIKMPATGMCTVSFPVMGLDMQTAGAAYFTSPNGPTSTPILASANGVLAINGTKVGTVTSLDLTVNGNYTVPGGVVGANTDPDIFPGVIDVSGTATILFDSVIYRDIFINETIAQMCVALTGDNTANAKFMAINMSWLKFNGATKDDGEKGLSLTIPFTALENVNTSGATFPNLQTTISLQDLDYT